MSINFTNNLEQFTSIQRAVKAKQFKEFGSKKQLQDANILSDKELKFVNSIKGTFSFALHVDGRYMAVTLYRAANNERKYNFLVLDLQAQAVAEVDSIKIAKQEILALVDPGDANEDAEEQAVETEEQPAATAEEDAELADTVKNLLDEVLGETATDDKKSRKTKTA